MIRKIRNAKRAGLKMPSQLDCRFLPAGVIRRSRKLPNRFARGLLASSVTLF